MLQLFLKLHFTVFLAGFTGVFGRLISYDAFFLVFVRFSLASFFIYFILKFMGKLKEFSVRDKLRGIIAGVILASHLVFFYLSIKLSNVSIGTVTLASTGFFTAILEPYILKVRFDKANFIYTLLCIFGLLLIFNFDTKFRLGILIGLLSAFSAALFAIYNKKLSLGKDPYTFANYEMFGGFLIMLFLAVPYLFVTKGEGIYFNATDIIYLILLALIFTVFLYILEVQLAEKISAFTMTMTLNLEPVYAILIAMVLFHEDKEVNFSFYLGVVLMFACVLLQNRAMKKAIARKQSQNKATDTTFSKE